MDKLKLAGKIIACVVGCAAAVLLAAEFLTELIDTVQGICRTVEQKKEAADFADLAE